MSVGCVWRPRETRTHLCAGNSDNLKDIGALPIRHSEPWENRMVCCAHQERRDPEHRREMVILE